MPIDIETIRAQFPILSRQFDGKPLIYLDSAASAQKPLAVINAYDHCMRQSYSNVHRGLYQLANEVTQGFEEARSSVASFINANLDEVIFTKSATEAVNLVAHSFGEGLKAGDEILITEMEHHANIVPWSMLCARKGCVLKWVPVLDDGSLDTDAFDQLLTNKVKIVAITHMSNVLGTVNDIRAIAQKAHAIGAVILIDGCQAVVHKTVDVKSLDCDFYVFSGHKLYGPTGIGVLYAKASILNTMPPFLGGGEMIASVSKETINYNVPPFRFEAGTPAIIEAMALKAAIEWMNIHDREAVAAHEQNLYAAAIDGLKSINGFREIGSAKSKGAILSFVLGQAHAHDVAQILDRYAICVRAGTHCAEPLMTRFGIGSSVRASFGIYNTMSEVEQFVQAVHKANSFF